MKQGAVLVFLGLVVLGVSLLALPQTRTGTVAITLTVPPILELRLPSTSPDLYLAPGTSAETTINLTVGTNDGPLDLHFSLLSYRLESVLSFEYHLGAEDTAQTSPSWIQIPPMSLSPPFLLPSSGWTNYTLSVRTTAQEDAAPGTYFQSLRMILRSMSGLIEIRDIPVSVTVLPGESASLPQAQGQGGTNSLSAAVSALESVNVEGNTLPECEQVLIITWEGITQVSWDCLPCRSTDSE